MKERRNSLNADLNDNCIPFCVIETFRVDASFKQV